MGTNLKIWLAILVFLPTMAGRTLADGPPVQWEKTFGGSSADDGFSVQQTTDGGYIIAGDTWSFGAGRQDVYLIKTDSLGNMRWQKTFGGKNDEYGTSVQQTSDGGYIITGGTYSFGAGGEDVYLIKTDSVGNLQWQRTFGGGNDNEYGTSVRQTSDGGYIITGAWFVDICLIKTDSSGNLLWQKTLGGSRSDKGYSVQQTSDGGYIIAGDTQSFGTGSASNVYLIKTDPEGNLLWQKTFGGTNDDYGTSVQQTTDGGYIITGVTQFFVAGKYDIYLVKTDSAGNLMWQNIFGGNDDDYGASVQQTADGGYIIAGITEQLNDADVYLIKTDSSGNMERKKTFGGGGDERGWSVQQTSDGGYIVAGWTTPVLAGNYDVYVIKVGPPIIPPIIYVDADAPGTNNGTSWENAFNNLQDALFTAWYGDEIRVAQGIYKPDQGTGIIPGDRTAAFQFINAVTIKGGYAGFVGPDPDARDIEAFKTILSGDLNSDDVKGLDPSELLNHPSRVDNSCHIFYHPAGWKLDATAIFDGFTITGGNANGGWPYVSGGGMYNYYGSPTISNCTFTENSAYYGGGMDNYNSSPIVEGCTFSGNSANDRGGGMCNDDSSPIVNNCTFTDNSAQYGGGMRNGDESSPTVTVCTFSSNSAKYGGGMYNEFGSSPTVTNCIFSGNSAGEKGGGMYILNDTTALTNCTFTGNLAQNGKAVACSYTIIGGFGNVQGTNCILWDDGDEIFQQSGSKVDITYSDIQGGYSGTGNINADPCFVNPDSNDYHLQASSPCINAGDPNYVPEPNETDMDGEQRVMLGRVDMGADEFNPFEVNFDVVSRRRIGRTIFEYDCNVTLRNISRFVVRGVQLEIVKASENMVIIEPNVTFGDIEVRPGESATSIDTCTLQVDRSKAIEPEKIVWKVKCQRADTGMPLELTINGVSPGGLEGAAEGKIDFEDLAEIASQWLWVGEAGSIPEDITGDGIVNLRDFAVLAEHRLEGR
jgi:hypothetical protein